VVELHIPLAQDRVPVLSSMGGVVQLRGAWSIWQRQCGWKLSHLEARLSVAELLAVRVACLQRKNFSVMPILLRVVTGCCAPAQQELTFEPTSIAPESYFRKLVGEGCRTLLTELTA